MQTVSSRVNARWDRRKLIQLIHVKAQEIRLADEARREMQERLVGKQSCSGMTDLELRTVLSTIMTMVTAMPPHHFSKRYGRDERKPEESVTKEQLDLIRNLSAVLGLQLEQYRRLCLRIAHHSWPQTRAEANKVIEAMKAMQRRGWRPRPTEEARP